jgi:hypothetical protein
MEESGFAASVGRLRDRTRDIRPEREGPSAENPVRSAVEIEREHRAHPQTCSVPSVRCRFVSGDEEPGFIDLIAAGEMAISDAQSRGMKGRLAILVKHSSGLTDIAEELEATSAEYVNAMEDVSAGNVALIERLEEDPSQLDEGQRMGSHDPGPLSHFTRDARKSERPCGQHERKRQALKGAEVADQPHREGVRRNQVGNRGSRRVGPATPSVGGPSAAAGVGTSAR